MPFSNEVVGSNGVLIRNWLQSQNYNAGVAGWRILKNGDAEFNNGVFRGSVSVGTSPGKRFIVNNTITGDPLDIYDASNNLIFSIDSDGKLTSYAPASLGDPYVRLENGQAEFNNASGFTTIDPPLVSAPSINSGTTELKLYSGTPDGGTYDAVIQLFGGTSAAGSEARITQRGGVTGDIVQTDSSNNDRQLIHVGSYSGTVAGGDGHWIFAHGAQFTPKYGILTPWDAASGDGIYQYCFWNNPFPNSTDCLTITRTPSGAAVPNGTLVGVHGVFFG